VQLRSGIGDVEPAPFLGYFGGDRDDAVGITAQQTREPLVEDRRLGPVSRSGADRR
jgi:hypothetical protein